ncbi:hypothetical protein Q7469_04940 [Glaesserella parasuis]|uniref:Uncharacterized protein n=1 Tax=Glaesserella parasuis TaxID=738 RepID=A0A6M8T6C7_GLAPU|nr:hypothetical protein [Glaesserella parasuis]EQA00326.1 putative lipoprotein [Glaesserella parasuis SW114]MDD2168704.1 hypothetical protein [Glaesserella parasuis]MDD2173331.1 hypothetical protein [Glaesserella parasuis]MDG6345323.1 hypothetical protein [Glaesserella parasuis]MDG6448478.1 hypothetical protein [Glaesserella parasuis]
MKKQLFILGLFSAFALTACSSTTGESSLKPSDTSYNGYSLKSKTEIADTELKAAFENALSSKLASYGYKTGDELSFVYDIKAFQRGNRFGRWWFGPLNGMNPDPKTNKNLANAEIQVNVMTVKGKSLGSVNANSKLYAGFFGGDALNSIENAAEEIATKIHESGILKAQ